MNFRAPYQIDTYGCFNVVSVQEKLLVQFVRWTQSPNGIDDDDNAKCFTYMGVAKVVTSSLCLNSRRVTVEKKDVTIRHCPRPVVWLSFILQKPLSFPFFYTILEIPSGKNTGHTEDKSRLGNGKYRLRCWRCKGNGNGVGILERTW